MTISIVLIPALSDIFTPVQATDTASVAEPLQVSLSISEVCFNQVNDLKYSNTLFTHLSHQCALSHRLLSRLLLHHHRQGYLSCPAHQCHQLSHPRAQCLRSSSFVPRLASVPLPSSSTVPPPLSSIPPSFPSPPA